MAKIERVREVPNTPIDPEYLKRRAATGWKLVSLEWERQVEGETEGLKPARNLEEVPFGFRVARDCAHLEEDPNEMQTLKLMMELMIQDVSLPRMAEELNRRELWTRDGTPWTQLQVFSVFPRVMDVAPRVFSSEEWAVRRKKLQHVAWNS